jgi:hypothetical protein
MMRPCLAAAASSAVLAVDEPAVVELRVPRR